LALTLTCCEGKAFDIHEHVTNPEVGLELSQVDSFDAVGFIRSMQDTIFQTSFRLAQCFEDLSQALKRGNCSQTHKYQLFQPVVTTTGPVGETRQDSVTPIRHAISNLYTIDKSLTSTRPRRCQVSSKMSTGAPAKAVNGTVHLNGYRCQRIHSGDTL